MIKCNICGRDLDDDAVFCDRCCAKQDEPEPEIKTETETETLPDNAPATDIVNVCPDCGKPISVDWICCQYCGKMLNGTNVVQTVDTSNNVAATAEKKACKPRVFKKGKNRDSLTCFGVGCRCCGDSLYRYV